jgi:PAS domain S-box-containing protein
VFYKDSKNNFIRVNKYFAQVQKKDKSELEGRNLSELYTKEIANLYFQDDLAVINSGIPKLNIEEPWESAEGLRWVNTNKIPFVDADGNTIGIIGISMDITERKKAEKKIELKNEQLEKSNAEKDKFFSIIAHDLRSPFNGFLGLTEIMAEGLQNLTLEEIQKIAVSMKKSAANLYSLLGNLLEWSLMQRGLTAFEPQLFLLSRIITESMALVTERADKKEIAISYDIPEDLSVFADSNMFEGIIRNLASNAVKFTNKGGVVNISAKTMPDNSVEISVKDTGIGMGKDITDNLFRLDIDTSRKGTEDELSSGLGLFICKDFIEKHGGKLRVESEEGKGSVFTFTIPERK